MSTVEPLLQSLDDPGHLAHLRSLARTHDVCFEIWPEFMPFEGRKVRTGVEVDLCGAVAATAPHLCAGCPICENTYAGIKEIAQWALPPPEGETAWEIQAFDHALHMARGPRRRPEVIVALHLTNGQLLGQISDQVQEHSLHVLRDRLAAVGVVAR